MQFERSPAALESRFATVLARFPDAEQKKVFGYPCAFVGGNMATGLHGTAWFVRLAPDGIAEVLALPGGRPFEPMPGRPMSGYVLLPGEITDDDAAIEGWVARSLAFTAGLPPKRR